MTFTDPSGHVAAVEYAVQILRGPLAAAGEVSKTAVLFSAVFGAAAGVVGYGVFGPEPKTVEWSPAEWCTDSGERVAP